MKKLEELSLKEHTDLKRSGLMWVIFPEAIGDYQVDCKPEPDEDEYLCGRCGCIWPLGQEYCGGCGIKLKEIESDEDVKDKCEWKDGKVNQCSKSLEYLKLIIAWKGALLKLSNWKIVLLDFCPFCGADIRKPELQEQSK